MTVSATIETNIQDVLFGYFKDAALTPPISWPDVEFVPTVGVAYYQVHRIMRATPQDLSIAFDGSTMLKGIFQIDSVYPDNAGSNIGLQLAEPVRALFAQGTTLTAGGRRLQIVKTPTIAAATDSDAPWVRLPVSIPYLLIN